MSIAEIEYRTLTMPRNTSRNAVRQRLVDEAEKNHWTLDHVRVLPSGARVIRLRRRILRVTRTSR